MNKSDLELDSRKKIGKTLDFSDIKNSYNSI